MEDTGGEVFLCGGPVCEKAVSSYTVNIYIMSCFSVDNNDKKKT